MNDSVVKDLKNALKEAGQSNTQIAIELIRNLILENVLPAGSNHLEGELATMLGMSRTPVREATLILETQGLLQVVPRHGVRISIVSADDMQEIYEVLTALEGLAVFNAANRKLSECQLLEVKSAVTEMETALARSELERWAATDDRFHAELINLGGNQRLAAAVDMYNTQVRRIRALTLNLRPLPTQSNEDHRLVLNAIIDGDATAARDAHDQHRQRAGALLISILRKYQLG